MRPSEILQKYGISAKKSLGQNFLTSDGILDKIATTLPLEGKNIVEVGPGYGALTEKMLREYPNSIELVELDPHMVSILEERTGNGELTIPEGTNFSIEHTDVLKYTPPFFNYVVIANIPYYITSPILSHFLYDVPNKPTDMVILMQKEVADKIREGGKNRHSFLSLSLAYRCEEIREVVRVGRANFLPPPKVDSSVLSFRVRPDYDPIESGSFLRLLKAGFSSPRKKLVSNLSEGLGRPKDEMVSIVTGLGFLETVRAEELGLAEWKNLMKELE